MRVRMSVRMSVRMKDRFAGMFAPLLVVGSLIIFTCFLFFTAISSYAEEDKIGIDPAHFPDSNFRSYISRKIDSDKDGKLNQAEREAVKVIDVRRMEISGLSGLEYFPFLKVLNCGENQIKTLDVSGNPRLEKLFCRENQLVSLNVTQNRKLKMLDCYSNQLKKLDVRKNTALTYLECSENELKTLDISKNTSLEILECFENQLKELDVSGAKKLIRLHCFDNSLKKLDIAWNPYLLRVARKGKRSENEGILSYSYEDAGGDITGELWLDADVKLIQVKTGWHQTDGGRYYYDKNGKKATGWKKIDGKKYYFGKNGVMRTGWKKIDGKKYYFGKNGVMRTGWKKIDGKYYYFRAGGSMAASQFVNGYWLKADGSRKKMARAIWRVNKTGRWYGNSKGWYARSRTLIIDGKKYRFDRKGYLK